MISMIEKVRWINRQVGSKVELDFSIAQHDPGVRATWDAIFFSLPPTQGGQQTEVQRKLLERIRAHLNQLTITQVTYGTGLEL